MKKVLGSFVLFNILATGSMAYPWQDDICQNYTGNSENSTKKALEIGKLSVKKYPKDPKAYYCLGKAYSSNGNYKLALENLKKAESLATDKKDLVNIDREIAFIFELIRRYDNAISYYNKVSNLAKDLGDTEMQANALESIANIYFLSKPNLDKALNYYEKAIELTKNEDRKKFIFKQIAYINYVKGNHQQAIDYYKKSLEICEKYGKNDCDETKLIIGDVYREMKDFKNAEKYLFESLEGYRKWGDQEGEASVCWSLGDLYRDKGDKKTAKKYYLCAYNIYSSIPVGVHRVEEMAEKAEAVLKEIKKLEKTK
jgi:tetratricopeptide (TPR) repeat protein